MRRLLHRLPLCLGLLLLALSLTACGFHLRGTVKLPQSMRISYVEGAKYPQLAVALRDLLQNSNVTLAPSAVEATARIRLLSAERQRRILSLDSQGQANAYELAYEVKFDVVDAEGEQLLPLSVLRRSRDLNVGGGNPLGKSREEEQIYQGLVETMAVAILQRIQYSRPDRSPEQPADQMKELRP